MDTKISKETINLIFNKLARFLNKLFPGIFVMELFFNKGYFSNPPNSTIEFILFIFWGIIFSIPYHIFHPISITLFQQRLVDAIRESKVANDIDIVGDEEKIDDGNEEFFLSFILLKLCLTYFIYKLITYYFVFETFFGISFNVWRFFATMLLVMLLSFPTGWIYSFLWRKLALRYVSELAK